MAMYAKNKRKNNNYHLCRGTQLTVHNIHVYVVVQFYPWFKFSFLLFLRMVMYDNNMIMSLKQKKRKFEPRIKLSHNIYID